MLDRQQRVAPHKHGPSFCKIQWNNRNLFGVDIAPDIELSPVRERKHAKALTIVNARVIEVPQLGTLIPRIPLPPRVTEREDALFRARTLFIPPSAAYS